MSETTPTGSGDEQPQSPERQFAWRFVRYADSSEATIELGPKYDGLDDASLTVLTGVIGRSLVKIGMQLVDSRVGDDHLDDEDDDR